MKYNCPKCNSTELILKKYQNGKIFCDKCRRNILHVMFETDTIKNSKEFLHLLLL